MLGKIRKILHGEKGFTLVGLMTVLIISGVVLVMGAPKYLEIQAKSEWDADKLTIENMAEESWDADANTIINFAKAAEIYAASNNKFHINVTLGDLVNVGFIDGSFVLYRKNNGIDNTSVRNKGEEVVKKIDPDYKAVSFSFNNETGRVNNLGKVIQHMIGNPPHGSGPEFPNDDVKVNWTETDFIAVTNLPNATP
jgi:Tfp pilus assembly protein PilE